VIFCFFINFISRQLFPYSMAGETSEAVLEQRMEPPKSRAFLDGFREGVNYVSPLSFLLENEPAPVMLVDRRRHFEGWFAGGAAGVAADGFLLYGACRVADIILQYF
jgi:hypothetical protein